MTTVFVRERPLPSKTGTVAKGFEAFYQKAKARDWPGLSCMCHIHSTAARTQTTRGPSWGHSIVVLGTMRSFLEPFSGHLSPTIDKVSEELTLRYPHEGPCVVTSGAGRGRGVWRRRAHLRQFSYERGIPVGPPHTRLPLVLGGCTAVDLQGDLTCMEMPPRRTLQ